MPAKKYTLCVHIPTHVHTLVDKFSLMAACVKCLQKKSTKAKFFHILAKKTTKRTLIHRNGKNKCECKEFEQILSFESEIEWQCQKE